MPGLRPGMVNNNGNLTKNGDIIKGNFCLVLDKLIQSLALTNPVEKHSIKAKDKYDWPKFGKDLPCLTNDLLLFSLTTSAIWSFPFGLRLK